MSSSSPSNDDDFVTITTKHRKKQQQAAAPDDAASKKPPTANNGASSSSNNSNISLRPRTMFAMKGRGRTESEGSAYRPQWSKDGEGFVSASSGGPTSFKDAATGGGQGDDHRGERRKSKVLRYTKEELLALHFTTTEAPNFPPETPVASEHSLPPVATLPFDYEEIYKQWSLNRNRGRGRGRGNAPPGGQQGTRGQQERGSRGDDTEGAKQQRDEHQRHNERDSTWERGAKITEGSHGDDVWDDVLEPGADSNEMDLSSMAEAAEKFRREMDAMREELQGPKIDPDEIKDDLDAFDKKLEDAAAAGQFDDSDNEEVPWDDPASEEQHNASSGNDPLEDRTASLLGRQSSGSHLFEALEPAGEQLVLEEKSSFSLSQMPVDEGFAGLSSLRLEVEDEWFYLDPQGLQQGPFKTAEMREWFEAGYFKPHLPIRFALYDIQNEEKRRVARETRKNDDQTGVQQEQPNAASPIKSTQKERKTEKEMDASLSKKNGKNVKAETNAWATKAPSDNSKSLKDIQQEEQREMLNKMSADQGDNANLAQMGAQLKMMLGVDSTAVASSAPSPPAPSAPAPAPSVATPAPTSAPAAPAASPWGTPAAVTKSNNSKSMRDILAEEERLAQERAKANDNAPTSSHWMNVVAGNKVAAATIPKPSRSVLGPVPASVLKSRQQIRAANGTAKPSPSKVESDASFWNFGAAQSADKESASSSAQVATSNAFGLNNVSSEFMTWALKQLKTIDSNANVTLLEYCASVEDPGEIREYLAAYLGSTPRVSAFATEFIQRKKTQHSGKKSPGHQDAQQRASETGSSNKRGKRRSKGQKIDPSLLNYSVGS
ncbi:hypothetical protein JG688_00010110 [Phytophthora aleatoria]|uniref:GYF domain-containing protein n=1 Tax=Phytophthora aleatoria TaxID=2496075 RepID=A0A8J5M665_9STRA|nr:hypothetical protein JG688_00010110 [Phytophthora aleatoria]